MSAKLLLNSLKAAGIALASTAALLFVLNIAAYSADDPDKLVSPLGWAALAACALICGFAAAKLAGEEPLKAGLAAGGTLILPYTLLFFIFGGGESFNLLKMLLCFVGILAVSAVGSLAGRPRAKSAAHTRKMIKKKYKI